MYNEAENKPEVLIFMYVVGLKTVQCSVFPFCWLLWLDTPRWKTFGSCCTNMVMGQSMDVEHHWQAMQILRRFLVCLRSSIVLTFAVENYGTQLVLGYSNFTVLSKYAIARWFRFPPHVFSVCTLPCETLDPVSCKFSLKLQISPMIGT